MGGEVILVVDDSREIVKHLTEHLLPIYGYRTLHAFDGQAGLNLIREEKPDLVMLDYNLPEMTGIDVLREMVQESINIPVVLMTGYGSEVSSIEAFRLGAKDYLIKPFTIDEIIETIDRALLEIRLLHDKEELAEELRRTKVEMSRLTHEMNMLASIGKAITSLLSVDKVLERVLETASYLTNAEVSTIWMPDDSGIYLQAYGKNEESDGEIPFFRISMANSQAGDVMRTGQPYRESKFFDEGVRIDNGYYARSVLYVPLKLRGVTLGVLNVCNLVALTSFSKRDEFLLSFLADYAAIALENARVFQAADQALAARLEELNTLIQITRTITSSLDLENVVRLTIQQVHNSWNIEASSLWWLDETKQSLKVLANVGTPADVLNQVAVPLGEGFVGHVAKTGKWIYTNDVASHPLHFREVDDKTGFKTRVLLCVPLLFRGKVVGAMQLLNKLDGNFDDQDIERALSIAAAVAIAVTNALMFKEAESQKQHLETTLEHSNNPLLIIDADYNLLLLNQEARTRLNLTPETIGKPVIDVIQIADLVRILTEQIDLVQQDAKELVLADGSVWLPRVAPVPGHGRILILQDIMHLKELEREKELFVTSVSHDMRTPLNSINKLTSSLTEVGSLNQEQEQLTQRILNATDHMMDLVNGLLELAKVTISKPGEHKPCDVLKILTEVINDLQGEALAKQVDIVLETGEVEGIVEGDPQQLRRAICNLVDNAIKYSPKTENIHVVASLEAESVLIKIKDRGAIIDDTDLPRVFDKFYRGQDSERFSGSSLDLALVQSIAKAHKGKVWAERRNGTGSTFYLRLPTMK